MLFNNCTERSIEALIAAIYSDMGYSRPLTITPSSIPAVLRKQGIDMSKPQIMEIARHLPS